MRFNKKLLFTTLILLILPLFATAQIRVNKVEDGFNASSNDGIIYALPRTIIRVDVTVEHQQMFAGPLRNYAEKYLGITNYIDRDDVAYSMKGVELVPVSEADPDQYYFVSTAEKTSKAAWQTILQMNGHGMITSLGTAGKIAATADGLVTNMTEDEVRAMFSKYADLNLYPKVDTIVRTINIDTITIQDYTFKTTMTNKPLDVKAREVAEMIQKVREGRFNLINGYQEVNYSEGALKFMNDELLRMEEEYLRLFTGAVVTQELTFSLTFLPTPENNGNSVPIFNMSPESGISEGSGGGIQGFIRIESHGNTSAISNGPANTGGGLVYRIPDEAIVMLIYNGSTIAQTRAAISQFGRVASLPADASNVEFDGATGGLKSIQLDAE